jgi:hypothetical protein
MGGWTHRIQSSDGEWNDPLSRMSFAWHSSFVGHSKVFLTLFPDHILEAGQAERLNAVTNVRVTSKEMGNRNMRILAD